MSWKCKKFVLLFVSENTDGQWCRRVCKKFVLLFVSENTDGQWCRCHCVSAVHLLGHHKDKL